MGFFPRVFQPLGVMAAVRGEGIIYAWMRQLSRDYTGGYWEFFDLTNGGFFVAPQRSSHLWVEVDGNGFAGYMAPETAGIVATLFALGQFCAEYQGQAAGDHFIVLYHALREFALDHAHAQQILAAID